jgi:hypothetical protein
VGVSRSTGAGPTVMTTTPPCETVIELALNVLLLSAVGFVVLALVLECQQYLEIAHAAVHDYLFPPDHPRQSITCDSPVRREKKQRWSNAKKREAKNRG